VLLQHYFNYATLKMGQQKDNIPCAEETGAASLGTPRMGMPVWLCPSGHHGAGSSPRRAARPKRMAGAKLCKSALHKPALEAL